MTIRTFDFRKFAVPLLGLFIAFVWFVQLGHRDLIDPDEGRYAEIPREMTATGDWLTPRLNGFKYFFKPPLQYWGTALSYSLFGESNASARLWTALLGFAGLGWTGYVGMRVYGRRAGLYAPLLLASYLLYFGMGHFLTLDMSLCVFQAVAIGAFVLAQSERDNAVRVRRWMLAGWVGMAAGTMTKGLVALLLPVASAGLYMLWQRDWHLWRHLSPARGLLVYCLLVSPWFIAISRADPEFASFFFIREHVERFTSTVHGRVEPWWYFLLVFALGTLPWPVTSIKTLIRPRFLRRDEHPRRFDPARFLWLYAVLTLLFFSASQSKLIPYILPMFPALALLAAARLARQATFKADIAATLLLALALGVTAIFIERFSAGPEPLEALSAYRPWLVAAAAVLAAGSAAALAAKARDCRAVAALSLSALVAFQLVFSGYQTFSGLRSGRQIADAIGSRAPEGTPVYSVNRYDPSVAFYLGVPLKLVTYVGEMHFGIVREPYKWIARPEDFLEIWTNQPSRAIAIISSDDLPLWRERHAPGRIIYRDPARMVLSRR